MKYKSVLNCLIIRKVLKQVFFDFPLYAIIPIWGAQTMRKIVLSLLTITSVIILVLSLSGCSDAPVFRLNEKEQTYYVFCGNNLVTSPDVEIPSTYEGLPVTHISSKSFSGNKILKSIVIPDSVVSIGEYAFYKCHALETVYIGSGVKTIDSRAFEYCENIKNVYYNGTVADWCDITFKYEEANPLNGAEKFYLKDNGEYRLATDLVIPEGMTEISNYAFYNLKGITRVFIPESVTKIGYYAFLDCDGLTDVYYNGSVADWCGIDFVTHGANPLTYAHKLHVTENGEYTEITDLTIPEDVTGIKNYTFIGLSDLESIFIHDKVDKISAGAFADCKNLLSVTLDKNSRLRYIEPGAFYGCDNLKYNRYDGGYYFGDEDNPYHMLVKADTDAENCIINDNTITICSKAFMYADKLTSMVIPDSVVGMGNSVFNGCKSLTSIRLSDNLTDIAEGTFVRCHALTGVDLPDGITSIGEGAFYECKIIKELIIPDGVTSIDDDAFSGCESLEKIVIPDSVIHVGYRLFSGCPVLEKNEYDYVYYLGNENNPYHILHSIKDKYLETYEIKDTTRIIYGGAFRLCKRLKEITIPDGVVEIGAGAFAGCGQLKAIAIPDSVMHVGSELFSGCEALESVTFCKGMTEIHDGMFYKCSALESLTLPDGITSIGMQAFEYCENLKSILIPDGVTSIGRDAFFGCSRLENVIIPDSVTSIGSFTFGLCIDLKSIVIGSGVKTLYYDTFGSLELKEIYYKGTEREWESLSYIGIHQYYSIDNATKYFYSESKPLTDGNYWHYDENGNVAKW